MGAWQLEAACLEENPEDFVKPSKMGRAMPRDWAEYPKSVCKRCPVTAECLKGAVDEDDEWTVRGGMTPEERLKVYGRKRYRPIHPMDHGTERGAQQHIRRGEDPCDECRTAYALARAERAIRKASA